MTFFDSEFWERLVLQLSQSEPLVLHAAIALGTLHENEETLGMLVSKDRMYNARHRFAVAQYNTAIYMLTSRRLENDAMMRALTLATCLIFVHIELLRGRYDPALEHIHSGLKILQATSGTNEHSRSPVESSLATAFARLDLQCAYFDNGGSGVVLEYSYEDLILYKPVLARSSFERLSTMKRQIDRLFGTSYKFHTICQGIHAKNHSLDVSVLAEQRSNLLSFHTAYRSELDSLMCHPDIIQSPRHWQSAVLLKMHNIASFVQVAVLLAEDEEMAYDSYISDFAEITALGDKFIISSNESWCQRKKRPTLSADTGIIESLFLTALKCRDPFIRRNAIALLESWPHREGFWDSALLVTLAQNVVCIEEGDAIPGAIQGTSEVVRANNFFAKLSDDQTHGTITYTRTKDAFSGPNEALRVDL
jgi:hypothetical protein